MIKLLLDFLPIALFFVAYKFYGLITATQVAILVSLLQLIWIRLATKKLPKVNLISFLSILILGGATLLMKNEIFVKWKPTAVYWLLASALSFSQLFSKKTILQRLAENNVSLTTKVWRQLNFAWICFFIFMGIINLYIVYNFSTEMWVNFKLFGSLGLTITFIILQSIYIAKNSITEIGTK